MEASSMFGGPVLEKMDKGVSTNHSRKAKVAKTAPKPRPWRLGIGKRVHRGLWPLGRIAEIFAGKDGHVRSAKVSTRSTTLVRPITKWCFLECYTPTQDERTVSKEVPPWYLTLFSGSRPKCPSQRKAGGMNFRRTFHWGRDVKTQNNTIVIFEFRIVRLAVSVISASLLSEKCRAYSFLSMWFDFTVSMLYIIRF